MEPYFECFSTDSKESLIELYSYLFRKKLRILKIVIGILAVVFFFAFLVTRDSYSLVLSILYILILVWYIFLPRYHAGKAYRKSLKEFDGNIPPARIQFGDEIRYQDGAMQLIFAYSKLKTVAVLKNSIVLENQAGNYILFPINSLIKGTVPQLLAFLKEKCPHLKLPDWKW